MPSQTVCRIVRQYNKMPVPKEDMRKLWEIAQDCGKVKNYVYQRYGGMKSLPKLYPGYTIQNEMTRSGLREELGMPSVYFYLAVFDALGDIKCQWTRTKSAILKKTGKNEGLTDSEKHFLRYLLKVNNAFDSALNGTPLNLPKEVRDQYDLLASEVDVKKMENYLRRQVRNLHKRPCTDTAKGFSMTERAYRYKDHGIYISIKEKRKRIFIPLTDNNHYTRQITLRLFPEEDRIELRIPVDTAVRCHGDYEGQVGISLGMRTMIVTDQGNRYGEDLEFYQTNLSRWIRTQSVVYSKNKEANPGRKKYYANKKRLEEQLHSYINQELNRFLKTEKPKVVYMPKLPKAGPAGPVKQINHLSSTWQRGYIRERLSLKCREQSIELEEVFAKGISKECSKCGALGKKVNGIFSCPQCGYEADEKENAAKNAKNRGIGS